MRMYRGYLEIWFQRSLLHSVLYNYHQVPWHIYKNHRLQYQKKYVHKARREDVTPDLDQYERFCDVLENRSLTLNGDEEC